MTPIAAFLLLLLTALGSAALVVLVLLALDHRANLRRIERKQDANHEAVADKLRADRACVLRDITEGRRKHDSDGESA